MPVTNYIWDKLSDNVLLETDDSNTTTAVYTNKPGQYGELISQHRGGVGVRLARLVGPPAFPIPSTPHR